MVQVRLSPLTPMCVCLRLCALISPSFVRVFPCIILLMYLPISSQSIPFSYENHSLHQPQVLDYAACRHHSPLSKAVSCSSPIVVAISGWTFAFTSRIYLATGPACAVSSGVDVSSPKILIIIMSLRCIYSPHDRNTTPGSTHSCAFDRASQASFRPHSLCLLHGP